MRPIAVVRECIKRLTAKIMCLQKKESFASFFSPLQHEVVVEGSSQLLVHHLSLLLNSHPDWVVLKTDLRNAFNSVEQSHLQPKVAKVFQDISRHAYKCMQVSALYSSTMVSMLTFCSQKKGIPLIQCYFPLP